MTILVIAPDTDETARRFADFAVGRGVSAAVVNGFGRVRVTVRAARDRACRTQLTIDGAQVSGILTRGVGDWGHEPDPERAFVRAETYAAFWSAVALWPGAVVNRPSAHGFFPRLDPLELVASGAVAPPRTVIVNDGTAPGTDAYPASARRVLVAGTETFETGERLDASTVAPVLAWLRRHGVDFADFTVEPGHGVPRLLDVSPRPSHHLFTHIEDRVYAALLNRLVP